MVMSQVLINDTTLTSIADAIREKNMNIQSPTLIDTVKIGYSYPEVPDFVGLKGYNFGSNVSKIKAKVHILYENDSGTYNTVIGCSGGKYICVSRDEAKSQANYTQLNSKFNGDTDYEGIFEGNAITFIAHDNTNYDVATVNLELTPLDENDNEYKYKPSELINALKMPSYNELFYIQGDVLENSNNKVQENLSLTADNLKGITRIKNGVFRNCYSLRSIELPEGIEKIGSNAFANCENIKMDILNLPSTLKSLGESCFLNCTGINAFKILNKDSVITYDNSYKRFNDGTTIYIPSILYNDYKNDGTWGSDFWGLNLVPYGEWVFDPKISGSLLFNQSKSFTIELNGFEATPTFSITSSNENIITISNIVVNADNTAITFDVNSLTTEGNATINISIQGKMSYNYTGNFTVYETIPESSYEVVAVENARYGFELNDNGYYESKNKGISSSYAICQVNIINPMGRKLYFDCINSGESNFDFGILSKVNTALSLDYNEDGSNSCFKSFKGQSSTNIQTVEYTDAIDNCFIQVKFRKDGSGDQDNDTLQFKVRFE